MKPDAKVYLITRKDLCPAQQAVQAAHALQEFNRDHPELAKEWHSTSNHLCFLAVNNETSLLSLLQRTMGRGYLVSVFREPDRDHELTAIAIEPAGKKICQGISLALS